MFLAFCDILLHGADSATDLPFTLPSDAAFNADISNLSLWVLSRMCSKALFLELVKVIVSFTQEYFGTVK